ncbi:MAG: hypothetical protein ACYCOU_23510 [Sulfobacillus sp.]
MLIYEDGTHSDDDPISEALIWHESGDPRDDPTGDFLQLVGWVNRALPQFGLADLVPMCWWNHRFITWRLRECWELWRSGGPSENFCGELHDSVRHIREILHLPRIDPRDLRSRHVNGPHAHHGMEWKTDLSGRHWPPGARVTNCEATYFDPVGEAECILVQAEAWRQRVARAVIAEESGWSQPLEQSPPAT